MNMYLHSLLILGSLFSLSYLLKIEGVAAHGLSQNNHTCMDDANYYIRYGYQKNTCKIIRNMLPNDHLKVTLCNLNDVSEACPVACGQCCLNDPYYRFEDGEKRRKCQWISRHEGNKMQLRRKKFCNGPSFENRTTRNHCPEACGICTWTVPKCFNDPSFSMDYNNKEWTCKKIRRANDYQREILCQRQDIRDACPQACGVCCIDDSSYRLITQRTVGGRKKGSTRHCQWIANRNKEQRRAKYCDGYNNGAMVRDKCPFSCGKCLNEVVLSNIPSSNPNMHPSKSAIPTFLPSQVLSHVPTSEQPTNSPTKALTKMPTKKPSFQPSKEQRSFPSADPSVIPSNEPSVLPSDEPSILPSDEPSVLPSDEPSILPSNEPSLNPSHYPSMIPSDEPSALPSDQPSLAPSDGPSELPSDKPSILPSDEPSVLPSDEPSILPSNEPSLNPSHYPSMIPSDEPSALPSDQSSVIPSDEPSALPSDEPSVLPSNEPSLNPSHYPSMIPSDEPSALPSDQPSVIPSNEPSELPSDKPSILPSDEPSVLPSDEPSILPSNEPSLNPSHYPSMIPSDEPSALPSDQPSLAPSDEPSELPSDQPNARPSNVPSISSMPTTANIALNKPASQSATRFFEDSGFLAEASVAVDGNRNGYFPAHTTTHTVGEYGPWWKVDLLNRFPIQRIQVYFRTDCCLFRSEGFLLQVLDGEVETFQFRHTGNMMSSYTFMTGGAFGNEVKISLPSTTNNILSIAEVEVYLT